MPQQYIQQLTFNNRKEQQIAEFEFTGGLITDKHESKLDPSQTPNVYNVLYNQSGSIKTRNGYTRYNDEAIGISADQSNTGTSTGSLNIDATSDYVAQTFVPSGTVTVSQVDLWLAMANSGETQYVTVEIWTTDSGDPDTLITDAEGPIMLVSGTSEAEYNFVFRHPVDLTAATTYALVVKPYLTTASSTTVYEVEVHHTGADYANGSASVSTDTGTTWTADTNKDLKFVVQSGGDTAVTGLMRYYNSTATTQLLAKVGTSLYRGNDSTGAMTAITFPTGVALNTSAFLDYTIVNDTLLVVDGTNEIKKYRGSTNANYSTGTISVTNGDATVTGSGTSWNTSTNAAVGEYIQLPDTKWYKIASIASDTSLEIEISYQGTTQSGQSYVISPWGEVEGKLNSSSAPGALVVPTPKYIANYSDRVWVASGNTLYFSVLDTSVTEEHFNDFDTSNNAGQIIVPGGRGDTITGIYALGNALCVFQRRAIYAIYGNSPANFELRNITNEIGMVNRKTLVEYNDVLIFHSDVGIVMFDGSNIKNISDGYVNSSIKDWANDTSPTATLWENKYLIGYTPSGDEHNAEALFYDLTRGIWGRVDHTHFNVFSQWIGGNDSGEVYFGSSTTGNIYRWDFGSNDDGYKINTVYYTPALGYSAGINDKAAKKFYIQQLTQGDYNMTVSQILDLGASTITGSAINLSPGTSSLWGTMVWDQDSWSSEGGLLTNRVAEFQGIGKYYQFKIQENGFNTGIEVIGIQVTARLRRLQ